MCCATRITSPKRSAALIISPPPPSIHPLQVQKIVTSPPFLFSLYLLFLFSYERVFIFHFFFTVETAKRMWRPHPFEPSFSKKCLHHCFKQDTVHRFLTFFLIFSPTSWGTVSRLAPTGAWRPAEFFLFFIFLSRHSSKDIQIYTTEEFAKPTGNDVGTLFKFLFVLFLFKACLRLTLDRRARVSERERARETTGSWKKKSTTQESLVAGETEDWGQRSDRRRVKMRRGEAARSPDFYGRGGIPPNQNVCIMLYKKK